MDRKRWPSLILPAGYLSLYAASWGFIWWVHRTDPGDGLEYLYMLGLTLPWWSIFDLPLWTHHVVAASYALAMYFGFRCLESMSLRSRQRRTTAGPG